MRAIIDICNHERLVRISNPPEELNNSDKFHWLWERFGYSLSKELFSEIFNSLIESFTQGVRSGTLFTFNIIVKGEIDIEPLKKEER